MNPRLAELVEQARDGVLSAAEDAELASLLAEPTERVEAAAQWRDGLLLTALATRPAGEVSALVRSITSSRPSQVRRQVRVRSARQRWRGMGRGLLAASLLAAIGLIALLAWPMHRAGSAVIATLGDDAAGVRMVRNGVAGSAQAGMTLLAQDQLVVDGGTTSLAVVRYPDHSRMELLAGTTVRLWDEAGAKRVRLDRGEVRCEITKQLAGRAMRLLTDQATTEVVGTRFVLRVEQGQTRLAVADGVVVLHRSDGTVSRVEQGGVAVAGDDFPPPPSAAQSQSPVSPAKASERIILSCDFEIGRLTPDPIGEVVVGPPRAGNKFCLAGEDIPENKLTRAMLRDDQKGLFSYVPGAVLAFDYWIAPECGPLVVIVWNRTQQASLSGFTLWSPELITGQWGHATVDLSTLSLGEARLKINDLVTEITVQTGGGFGKIFIDNISVTKKD